MIAKIRGGIAFLNARLHERSTWLFWLGSVATVASLPMPFNFVGFGVMVIAGLIPDGPMRPPVDPSAK